MTDLAPSPPAAATDPDEARVREAAERLNFPLEELADEDSHHGVVAVLVLAALAWRCGWLDRVLPQPWQYDAVMAEVAPPPAPAPSPAP